MSGGQIPAETEIFFFLCVQWTDLQKLNFALNLWEAPHPSGQARASRPETRSFALWNVMSQQLLNTKSKLP
jgi:hypothetical protein